MEEGKFGERFERLYNARGLVDGIGTVTRDVIIKDHHTGVLYYQIWNDQGTALIPLLGSDGKPIIEPVEK